MHYIWQNSDWPNFKYDLSGIQDTLYSYIRDMSTLSTSLDQTQAELSYDTLIDIIVAEALKTSEIEGEYYSEINVRSSVRKILGLDNKSSNTCDKRAESLSYLMIEARNTFDAPLTEAILFHWHGLLMKESKLNPKHISQWRKGVDPMQIISGPIGNERVHYEAPPSEIVVFEMNRFMGWFNSSANLQGPVRAAIAHLYFKIIHPFEDGNGRIGRIISEKALSQDLQRPILISISSEIMKDKKRYYSELSRASGENLDITAWIHYFVNLVYSAHLSSKVKVEFVLRKAKFWRKFDGILNERQRQVINRVFEEGDGGFEGGISAKKYMQISGCSKATATRDLADLFVKKVIRSLSFGGRGTSYEIEV